MVLKSFNLACLTPKSHLSSVAKPDKWVFCACLAETGHRLLEAHFLTLPGSLLGAIHRVGPSLHGDRGNLHRSFSMQNSEITFLGRKHYSFPKPVLTESSVRSLG